MHAGLLVDGNPIRAGIGKFGYEEIGIFDHEVAIEGHLREVPERLHHWRADGEVGDEVAVHEVQVEDRAAALKSLQRVAAQLREVSGEDRRRKFDFHEANVTPSPEIQLYDGQPTSGAKARNFLEPRITAVQALERPFSLGGQGFSPGAKGAYPMGFAPEKGFFFQPHVASEAASSL
jgi:hypothetical protein